MSRLLGAAIAAALMLGFVSVEARADTPTVVAPQVFKAAQTMPSVVFDGMIYFAANDDVHGTELWRTDGTPQGTEMVVDLRPGGSTSSSNPADFVVAGDRLFFGAGILGQFVLEAGSNAPVRWSTQINVLTNAVALGDNLIFGLNGYLYRVGPRSIDAVQVAGVREYRGGLGVLGSWVYFAGYGTDSRLADNELWRTDGTVAEKVKDIAPNSGGLHASNPHAFVATRSKLFFQADDSVRGTELWVTDGTTPGTHLVHEHQPGSGGTSFSPYGFAVAGDVLVYVPRDYVSGYEPWRTDGTEGGTQLLKDILPGVNGDNTMVVHGYAGRFAIISNSRLYTSTGTASGTSYVAPVSEALWATSGHLAAEAGGRLWFVGNAGSNGGTALWVTDGTAQGTYPAAAGGFALGGNTHDWNVGQPIALGGRVFYPATFDIRVEPAYGNLDFRLYGLDAAAAIPTRVASRVPTITRSATNQLTVSTGSWQPAAGLYTYQWYADGVAVSGATRPTLFITSALRGKRVHALVTATGVGAPAGSATTVVYRVPNGAATGGAAGAGGEHAGASGGATTHGQIRVTKAVAIKVRSRGNAAQVVKVRTVLRVVKPRFAQNGVALTYRWVRNGRTIAGATKATYRVGRNVRGKRIAAVVTARMPVYQTRTLTTRAMMFKL